MARADLNRVMESIENDEMLGFCKDCGNEQGPLEPDGETTCEECGGKVYGAENYLLMFG